MAVEDGGDLSGDLAGGEVAADAELGGEAELAVDGAADLAGDADGGAFVVVRGGFLGLFLGGCWGSVAAFAAIAAGHPDGLDGFAVGEAHEVALGSVDGAGGLDDLGEADGIALGLEGLADGEGEGRDLVERRDALAMKRVVELCGAVEGLAQAVHQAA